MRNPKRSVPSETSPAGRPRRSGLLIAVAALLITGPTAHPQDRAGPRPHLPRQGENLVPSAASQVKQAREAVSDFNPKGMLAGFQISQYTFPSGWAYNNLNDVRTKLREIFDQGLGFRRRRPELAGRLSDDGQTIHLVFSAEDRFKLRKAGLTVESR